MVSTERARVLVVEDDPTVAEVVTRYLEREGLTVEAVGDGLDAIAAAEARWPDLVVLDLMLPGLDGLEVCRRLRARAPVPVIMLTAKGDEDDRVVGLELGADDYVAKPFSPRELTARVRAVLRRARGSLAQLGPPVSRIEAADLVIDLPAREVRRDGESISLTAREFELLAFLAAHPREVFRREELLERVWGYTFGDTATVTVHVRRLREKVEADPVVPRHLTTVWGVDAATVARYHRTIREETDRLAALVDDLLELSRTQAGALRLRLQQVPLGDLVSDAIAGIVPIASSKGVRLEGRLTGPSPELLVSPPEILRALRNVLENAVRHTPADGSVVVAGGFDGPARAYVSVTDTGPGVAEADLDRVFDVAFRADAARTPGGEPAWGSRSLGASWRLTPGRSR